MYKSLRIIGEFTNTKGNHARLTLNDSVIFEGFFLGAANVLFDSFVTGVLNYVGKNVEPENHFEKVLIFDGNDKYPHYGKVKDLLTKKIDDLLPSINASLKIIDIFHGEHIAGLTFPIASNPTIPIAEWPSRYVTRILITV